MTRARRPIRQPGLCRRQNGGGVQAVLPRRPTGGAAMHPRSRALPAPFRLTCTAIVAALIVLVLPGTASVAHAAWAPFPVCQAPATQVRETGVADGSGGAIVAWLDARSG